MKKYLNKIIIIFLLIIIDLCAFEILVDEKRSSFSIEEVNTLSKTISIYKEEDNLFNKIKSINSDAIAWISFDSGLIDLPVCVGQEYLNLTFYKEPTTLGIPFVREGNDFDDTNTVIYGHSSSFDTTAMFSPLLTINKDNFDDNKNITVYLEDEIAKYEITNVYEIEKEKVKDHNFQICNFESENEFNKFIRFANENNLVNNINKINYQDKFITLQTCADAFGNKLLIILAKQK